MKKKVILLTLSLMLLVAGVVSAAANWGKFEGYNIVKLIIDGKAVTPKDTPPVILKGRTMVPLSMLEQAGLKAVWDSDTYTVDVTSSAVRNNQYATYSKKYKELIDDANFYLEFSKELEIHYLKNLGRSTTKKEDDELREILEEVRGKYSASIAGNEVMEKAVSPLQINGVYTVQNSLLSAANNYVKAFESLMVWKYALDNRDASTDQLTKQAAQNTADKNLAEYEKLQAEAVKNANEALVNANTSFRVSINEIK